MELLADLAHFPAAEALQWAAGSKFDGQILFRRNKRALTISFTGGQIVLCESNHRSEWFAQHLFAQGLVDAMDLAATRQQDRKGRLGTTLVQLGILDRKTVRRALSEHILALACSTLTWPDGIVAAKATTLRSLIDPEPEPLDPLYVTLEAARRQDEIERIRQVLAHDNVRLGRDAEVPLEEISRAQRRLVDTLEPGQTAGDLHATIGGCKFAFERNVAALIEGSVLTVESVGPAPEPPRPNGLTLVDVLLDNDLERRLRA